MGLPNFCYHLAIKEMAINGKIRLVSLVVYNYILPRKTGKCNNLPRCGVSSDLTLECKSKRNAAGLSATIAFTPSDCRRFPAGPVAFSRTGRARNAPKHGIRASAGHAHASPAQSFAGLSATPVRFSLPGRFFRLFSPVNYLLPPSRDGFRTTSSGLIRTIPSSPSRSLGRSLEAACRGVFPPRLLLG